MSTEVILKAADVQTPGHFAPYFTCARCAVYKPLAAVTFTKREALAHLIEAHPNKLLDALDVEGLIKVTDVELGLILVDTRDIDRG